MCRIYVSCRWFVSVPCCSQVDGWSSLRRKIDKIYLILSEASTGSPARQSAAVALFNVQGVE
eukprot:scaffold62516_cov58-Phaeocystis_antarctica.AAC.3